MSAARSARAFRLRPLAPEPRELGLAWGLSVLILPSLWCPLTGCARESYQNADLQIEVDASLPLDAEHLHVCVEGVGTRTVGASGTLYAMHGLPPEQEVVVTVDVLGGAGEPELTVEQELLLARAGPLTLQPDQIVWHVGLDKVPPQDPLEPCQAVATSEKQEETWLLAIRFQER